MPDGDDRSSTAETAPATAEARSHWTAGRVIGLIFTSIGGLIGLALLLGGLAVMAAYAFGRDDDGYFSTDPKQLQSPAFAVTSEEIDLGEADWAPDEILGDIRIQVDSEGPVFVGIGADEDVDAYLGGVASDELTGFDGDDPEFSQHPGRAPATPPGAQNFWAAWAAGSGEQSLTWDADFGSWTAVLMNADGGPGVDVEAEAGIKLDWAIWAGLGMFVTGLLLTGGAVVVIVLIGRRASRASPGNGA
jgi:hypothetical protein